MPFAEEAVAATRSAEAIAAQETAEVSEEQAVQSAAEAMAAQQTAEADRESASKLAANLAAVLTAQAPTPTSGLTATPKETEYVSNIGYFGDPPGRYLVRALDKLEACRPVMLAPVHGPALTGDLAPTFAAMRRHALTYQGDAGG